MFTSVVKQPVAKVETNTNKYCLLLLTTQLATSVSILGLIDMEAHFNSAASATDSAESVHMDDDKYKLVNIERRSRWGRWKHRILFILVLIAIILSITSLALTKRSNDRSANYGRRTAHHVSHAAHRMRHAAHVKGNVDIEHTTIGTRI